MPTAQVGQKVLVDAPELQEPGTLVGGNVVVNGMVTEVDPNNRLATIRLSPAFSIGVTGTIKNVNESTDMVTVELDEPLDGQETIVVTAERVAVIQ